ncbi:MAG: hypothetical protein M1836_004593 [Candelina mexicana]|nr:MAG: hypothetical protein M1836_004593 [Candelina mexicana]
MPEWVQLSYAADLGFHAVPALLLLIDLLFLSPPWTITVAPALALSGTLAFVYWFWIELCYQHNGWYPYPLFEVLSQTQRIALFAASAVVMTLSTATLKWLYGRVNGYGTARGPSARPGAVKSE